jgi:hypothetical protein
MRPGEPSGGVEKLALFVPEPSCASALTASLPLPPLPPLPPLSAWKLPLASVKPYLRETGMSGTDFVLQPE